jgi:NAD(P)H-dependent FMN reductase
VGFVSYGGHAGGSRAVEQLKQVVLELHMVPVRDNVTISMVFTGLNEDGSPKDLGHE